jgi:23S rRNA pseudouridine2605 synthase
MRQKNNSKEKARKTNKGFKPITKTEITLTNEPVRLNKYLASTGLCSRRQVDQLISEGKVTVNGTIITEMGAKVSPADKVEYIGSELKPERYVYILLNKPKDTVTELEDPHAKRTVMDLVKNACIERIFPVGLLDMQTTGVLLLTNDSDLTEKLTLPGYNKLKIYNAYLDKNLNEEDFKTILDGLELEDGFIKADALGFVDELDHKQIGIEIHSGKNRVVRRIFEQLGYKVLKLDRVYFAGLTKKGLQRGHWRHLSETEIASLKMGSYK